MNPTKTTNVFHHSPVIQHRLVLWVAEPKTWVFSFSGRGFEHFPAKTAMQINLRHRNCYEHLVSISLCSVSLDHSDYVTLLNPPLSFGGCHF